MSGMRREDNQGWLMKYWPIITFVIFLIFTAGATLKTLSAMENRLKETEVRVEKNEICDQGQQNEIIELRTIVRENLPSIKKSLEELVNHNRR